MAFGSEDRRGAPRRNVHHDAAIINPWGAPVLCRIVDMSVIGARLEAHDPPAVDSFYVIDLEMGVAYRAQVAWRRHPQIGTRFVETWRLADDGVPRWMLNAAARADSILARQRGRKVRFRPAA